MTSELVERFLRLPPQQRRALLEDRPARTAAAVWSGPDGRGSGPASPGQEALWLQWRLAPDRADFHVPHCYDVHGPLDADRMAGAVDALVARHGSLRTSFTETERGLTQVVGPAPAGLLAFAEAAGRDAALERAAAFARPAFDLRAGPPVRACLWRYGPQRHLLAVVCHHIVVDEVSSRVIDRELAEQYRGPGVAAALPVQYYELPPAADAGVRDEDVAHWRAALSGARPSGLVPAPSRVAAGRTGATLEMELAVPVAAALRTLGATPFMTAAAAFAVFLARHTGSADVTFGTPVSVRPQPGSEALVGYFLNLVPLRLAVDPDRSFLDLVGRARTAVTAALRHARTPFQDVVRAVVGGGNPPPVDVILVHQDAPGPAAVWADGVEATRVYLPAPGANELTVAFVDDPPGGRIAVRYAVPPHDPDEVRRWVAELHQVCSAVATRPHAPLADLVGGGQS